jgi:hypothetical protein
MIGTSAISGKSFPTESLNNLNKTVQAIHASQNRSADFHSAGTVRFNEPFGVAMCDLPAKNLDYLIGGFVNFGSDLLNPHRKMPLGTIPAHNLTVERIKFNFASKASARFEFNYTIHNSAGHL